MMGLDLEDLAVDGGITKAPSGGAVAGRSPVDRGKGGRKRSVVTDGTGIPLHVVAAGAHRNDAPRLPSTLAGREKRDRDCRDGSESVLVHLDRGSDSRPTRALLAEWDSDGAIARTGVPAPVQAGARWIVERTHAGMNGSGTLRRCTERRRPVVDFSRFRAAAIVVVRQRIHRARRRSRRPTRPTTRRLK